MKTARIAGGSEPKYSDGTTYCSNEFAATRRGPELIHFKPDIIKMEIRHPFALQLGNVVRKVKLREAALGNRSEY